MECLLSHKLVSTMDSGAVMVIVAKRLPLGELMKSFPAGLPGPIQDGMGEGRGLAFGDVL